MPPTKTRARSRARVSRGPNVPTVKDVAKAAGCSTATVSRALAAPEKVSPATRAKVAQAVAETGYTPNAAARSLRRSESKTIVVILPDASNPFFSEIIAALEDDAHRAGYKVLIGDARHSAERTAAYFDLVPTNQADGIILLTSEVPPVLLENKQLGSGFPLVMACEYVRDYQLPTIRIDNQQASSKMLDHLISLGHSDIATITGPMHNPVCVDRHQGYRAKLAQAGLADHAGWSLEGDFTSHSGYQQGKRLLSGPRRPSAIFCHNDAMAIGVLKAARDLGIRVPEQLSVAGFDDIVFSEYCEPELTTVHQPRAEIGRQALRLLLDLMASKDVAVDQVLGSQLIVRGSTAHV